MFAVYVCLAEIEPDGTLFLKDTLPPADNYNDFCWKLDVILDRYNLKAISSESDTRRNCVMILTDDDRRKICVEPNYYFNCMNYVALEEIKSKVDDAINKRITHVCSRCGCTEDVCFDSLTDMSNHYEYLPDGWKEVQGNKLCSSCCKEYRDMLSGFMKK